MNPAFNMAWIGFGWAQDISVEGSQPGDVFTFTVHRVGPAGRSASWTGSADSDGTLRVRLDGTETATWAAGVMPSSLRIRRGDGAGVIADLPPVVVKVPAIPAGATEPLVSDQGKPVGLRLTASDGAALQVTLHAGMKGDKGGKGDTGDVTPELIAARDQAVASATSSAADAQATAGDRAATAADRMQVRADQIEVADDRMRTAADRVATAADRTQTGQDRTAVVGLRAETETFRDSASGHRAAAQAAATSSQANRDATAADLVQTGQDREIARSAAIVSQSNRDFTAADRVQTGQDRAAAAASAAAAAAYDPAPFNAHLTDIADPHQSSAQAQVAVRDGVAAEGDTLKKIWAALTAFVARRDNPNEVTKAQVGLSNVDNTSDANKPISTATATALAGKQAAGSYEPARTAVTQAIAEAGTGTAVVGWSSERVGQAVAAQAPNSFRNKLLNTSHLINQRGYVSNTATTAAGQYTIDRWRVVVSGQRLIWAADAAGIPTFTAPAGGVEQIVEAANIEAGTYVLSWTGTATATVNGTAVANGGQVALNGQVNAIVRFINGTFREPQLERAIRKTSVERRPLSVETMLCRAYYRTTTVRLVFTAAVADEYFTEAFPAEDMRAAPSATVAVSGQTNAHSVVWTPNTVEWRNSSAGLTVLHLTFIQNSELSS